MGGSWLGWHLPNQRGRPILTYLMRRMEHDPMSQRRSAQGPGADLAARGSSLSQNSSHLLTQTDWGCLDGEHAAQRCAGQAHAGAD